MLVVVINKKAAKLPAFLLPFDKLRANVYVSTIIASRLAATISPRTPQSQDKNKSILYGEVGDAVHIVDTVKGWPEFVFVYARYWERRLFASIWTGPFACNVFHGVWCVFKRVWLLIKS